MEFSVYSDIGGSSVNEDYADAAKIGDYYVFALADGLGGHGGGDIASKTAVETVIQTASGGNGFSVDTMEKCFLDAQSAILALQKEGGRARAAKTTLVILMTDGRTAFWGHIGDSRLYWFRNNRLKKRTLDHSVSQMLAASKKIRPEELNHHEDRSMLLHALGARWQEPYEYEIDCRGVRVKKGDAFLLCSDGLWEWMEDKDIYSILISGESVQCKTEKLVRATMEHAEGHETDNTTGLLAII